MSGTRLIATVLGVGNLRPAPGTWGSLAALPLAWALHQLGGFWLLAAATLLALFGGWWAIAQETADTPGADPSEIVIDELVGQWIALWPVSYGAMMMGVDITRLWPGWVVAFVCFRLFDIWKPGPVGWADRRHDPLGVMLDDVFAGVMSGIVVIVLAALAHGVLMR
ncbi:phosphatidylglycerophosphatase A family protein [Pseudooceanicola sp. 502str34]